MMNNIMGAFMNLMSQGGQNPQNLVNSILQNNPDFAKAIQGQNPQSLAMQELQRRGIDPRQFMSMINGGRR